MATAAKINGDEFSVTVGDYTVDLYGENNVYLQPEQHSTNKFVSQKIKENIVTKDGTKGSTTITCVFDEATAAGIISYWENAQLVTYTAGGMTWTNCLVRLAGGPNITPGQTGYVTMSIEITSTEIPGYSTTVEGGTTE